MLEKDGLRIGVVGFSARPTDPRQQETLVEVDPVEAGRAAVVVPNGTLFGDGVCARIKEELLKNYNLHTIVRLPEGTFAPYTDIPANLLFFDRTGLTDTSLVGV